MLSNPNIVIFNHSDLDGSFSLEKIWRTVTINNPAIKNLITANVNGEDEFMPIFIAIAADAQSKAKNIPVEFSFCRIVNICI